MKFRGLLAGVAILIVLGGLLYWSNRSSSAKAKESAAPTPSSPKVLALNQADIIKLEVKKRGADDVVLSKNTSGEWQINAPKEYGADSGVVSSMLSTLASLNAERVVEEKASALEPYGLTSPSVEVVVTETGSKSQDLLLGDDTPTHSGSYAALAGDPRVFTIASYEKTNVDKSLNDLRDKRFLTLQTDKINRLEVLSKAQSIEFDRYKDRWQIVKPKPMRADSAPLESLITNLVSARIDLSQSAEDQAKAARAFPKAEAVATVNLTSDTATQEMSIRKIGKDYYAKSSLVDAPYKVGNDIALQLQKPLDDYRSKKLFDFGYADPDKIELKDLQGQGKSYYLTRGGSDWWGPDGKKIEIGGAYSFLDKLRDLKANKFVDSGFGTPKFEINVTSSNGGQGERVLLSGSGAEYVARRENDPTLYQVDGKAVEELQHAAQEMKPAGKADLAAK